MKTTLDLRKPIRSSDHSWLLAWVIAFMYGVLYLVFLNHGCHLDGIMTSAGKVCVNN